MSGTRLAVFDVLPIARVGCDQVNDVFHLCRSTSIPALQDLKGVTTVFRGTAPATSIGEVWHV
jgi:hypothetical protein